MVTEDQIKRTEALLSKTEIIDFPQYNFKVKVHYNDLNDDQLCRAKQEIINTTYNFKEAFGHTNKGMKEVMPDTVREFQIFIFDNRNDFVNYTGNDRADGFATGYQAYLYKGSIGVLRHEFGHQLTYHIRGDFNLSDTILEGVANYIMSYHPLSNTWHDNFQFTDSKLESLKNSKITTYLDTLMSFLEKKHPNVLNEILLNKRGHYDNALDFFKAKFPDMVNNIPASDRDSYREYDQKLFYKILENPKVRQDYLDFFSEKIAENKYIKKVHSKDAFIISIGNHIGTNKDEEYYEGIIFKNMEKNGTFSQIGAFSPMEYSYSSNEIKVFNHATKDSIIIPTKYHNLKLVKVDCNFKLAFCDERGNEYINIQECKNKTKDLIYTDNAQKAFSLVDLYSIKGITGQEENLGKVFSIKPTNLNSEFISVYDGNKNIGSFTNEVGYTNRGKFYFKDEHSTDFKVYDKNRALIVVEDKGDGKCKLFLKDGRDIDDRKFQDSNIQLKDSNLDYGCSQDKENEPGKVGAIKFDYHNFTVKLHYSNHLSNDKLQEIINEVKRDPYQLKTLLNIKEQDTTSHELQLYLYPDKRSYQKDTGSLTVYGHFDPKSNSMYIDLSDEYALKRIFTIIQNKKVLPNKEVIELPSKELQIIIYYNNLGNKELEAAKQEITDALYDFHELYGIEKYGTAKTITVFMHDNKGNYFNYAGIRPKEGSTIILADQYSIENKNIANIFYYPSWESYKTLRYQISDILSKEPNHERKIIAHPDSKGHAYINTLDILKATAPEVFDKNGHFKHLGKIDNADTHMRIILRDANKNPYDNSFYDGIDYSNSPCVNKVSDSRTEIDVEISNYNQQCDIKKLFTEDGYSKISFKEVPQFMRESYPLRIADKTTHKIILQSPLDHHYIPVYVVQDGEDEDDTIEPISEIEGNFMIEKGYYIGIDKHTEKECYQAEIIDDNDNVHSTISPMLYLYFLNGIRIFNQATNDSIYIPKRYRFLKQVKIGNESKLTFCDKNGKEYRDTHQYKKAVAELVNAADAFERFALIDSQSIEEIVGLKQHHKNILSLHPATENGNQAFKLIDIFNGNKKIGSFTNKVGYCKDNKFYFEDISTGVKITGEDLDEFSFQDLDHIQEPDNMQHEVSNIQYYMINNRIIIYDSELNDSDPNKRTVLPKQFSYLKLVKDENGEYKFALCNEKGVECPNDQCGKYKYIDTEAIKDGVKSFNFKDLCDKKCIFSILPSDTNPQTIKILDNNKKEIGILSNYINDDNNNNPNQDNNLPSEAEPDHERKIIAHPDSKGRTYINTLDILKATAPEAFDENGNFKYLDKIDDINIETNIILKDANKNLYDYFSYENIKGHYYCVSLLKRCNGKEYIEITNYYGSCDLKKLFAEDGYSKISFKEVPQFMRENYPFTISDKTTNEIIFKGVQDSDDIPVYASYDYLF